MQEQPLLKPNDGMKGSLRSDGSRTYPQPADVKGRFTRWRTLVFWGLIAFWVALPWVRISGRPAVFLDIEHRQFFLFGATFNAQDFWLVFFVLTGLGFTLIYVTALIGRVWCGWACPQTVWLEAIYRRIERVIEGPREVRIRRNKAKWTLDKFLRKAASHSAYLFVSFLIGHVFVAYFVSIPKLYHWMQNSPYEHPEAFLWAFGVTALTYFNFAWFREQLCLVICPYGRLQSILQDADSYSVGYDTLRGEPRGKAKDPSAGSCVDCGRCETVCPMGIDIREGHQMDCIACMRRVDACDEIMDKVQRPRGLVRYDSPPAFNGKTVRFWRPRTYLYTAIFFIGLVVAIFAVSRRTDFDASLLRMPGAPFVIEHDTIRNSFEVHVVNKRSEEATYELSADSLDGAQIILPVTRVTLQPLASRRSPVVVLIPKSQWKESSIRLHIRRSGSNEERVVTSSILGGS